MTDSARRFLLERHYPNHVVDGGLERLLRVWEHLAESVAQGEVQYQDDYLNDMDGRAILEELLPHLEISERAEAQRRLALADARHANPVNPDVQLHLGRGKRSQPRILPRAGLVVLSSTPSRRRYMARPLRSRPRLPNKRLKLPGAHKWGGIALPRWRAFVSAAPPPCARGHCARSLSAIR